MKNSISTKLATVIVASFLSAYAFAETKVVTIENVAFSPIELKVKKGDTVKWENKDLIPHTATATAKHAFDSKTIDPGKSWSFKTKKKGTFEYMCSIHTNMKAKLIVE